MQGTKFELKNAKQKHLYQFFKLYVTYSQGNGNTKCSKQNLRVDHDFCSWNGCVGVFQKVLSDHSVGKDSSETNMNPQENQASN